MNDDGATRKDTMRVRPGPGTQGMLASEEGLAAGLRLVLKERDALRTALCESIEDETRATEIADKAVDTGIAVGRIVNILWPHGRTDEPWTAATVSAIADIITGLGLRP